MFLKEVEVTGPKKIAVILNGLGATKYEELFVIWASVSKLLSEAGFEIIEPEVGELVTSLDMAGCSLTITTLNDELEKLWRAPADTPAYKKHASNVKNENLIAKSNLKTNATPKLNIETQLTITSTKAGIKNVAVVVAALTATSELLKEIEEELGMIDAIAGDGDHGRGMLTGIMGAQDAATATATAGEMSHRY